MRLTISAGLLPLKLNTGADKKEVDRASLLIRSLAAHWLGSLPFSLHIVCREDELRRAAELLSTVQTGGRIDVHFHSELDIFPAGSPALRAHGMYRQQLIKLFAPMKLGLEAFITFDSDVVCLRDFDESSFVSDGRIISKWEPRHIHSWWENSTSTTAIWSDLRQPGLGVTPNTLSSAICQKLYDYYSYRGMDAIVELCAFAERNPYLKTYEHEGGIPLSWSEYSIYTLVAEWFGLLPKMHLTSEEVSKAAVALHSQRCVWSAQDAHKLVPNPNDPGFFLIVQSWAGIGTEEIVRKLALTF